MTRKDPATRAGVYKRIGDQLGVHPEALRTWVQRAEVDEGLRPGTTSADAARIAELERENRERRRANAILKSISAFLCGGAVRHEALCCSRGGERPSPSGRGLYFQRCNPYGG